MAEFMALINCPECKKEISDKVKSCPHCGYPLEINSVDNTNQMNKNNWNKYKDLNEWKPAVRIGKIILTVFLWCWAITSIIGAIISIQQCNAVSY